MRFLVDESAGVAVATFLQHAGHDVVAVAEAMPQADDARILERGANEDRVLVTNDKDFGALVFRSRKAHAGVILLRLHDESSLNRVRILNAVLQRCGDALSGRFIVATETHIRVRRAD